MMRSALLASAEAMMPLAGRPWLISMRAGMPVATISLCNLSSASWRFRGKIDGNIDAETVRHVLNDGPKTG